MPDARPVTDQHEDNRTRVLTMAILGILPEIPGYGKTFGKILRDLRGMKFPDNRERLRSALSALSNGFEYEGSLYRLGVTEGINPWWFNCRVLFYKIRVPLP